MTDGTSFAEKLLPRAEAVLVSITLVGAPIVPLTLFFLVASVISVSIGSELVVLLLESIGYYVISTGIVVVAYLWWTERWSTIEWGRPSPKRIAVAAVIGLVAFAIVRLAYTVVNAVAGVAEPTHELVEILTTDPVAIATVAVVAVVLAAPFEELLFRGVIQPRLGETFSTWGAIVVTSIAFSAIHYPAYAGQSVDVAAFALVLMFGLSIALGVVYERRGLIDAIIVHAAYNATTLAFAILFVA